MALVSILEFGSISIHKIKSISFGYNNLFQNDNNGIRARNRLKNRKKEINKTISPSFSLIPFWFSFLLFESKNLYIVQADFDSLHSSAWYQTRSPPSSGIRRSRATNQIKLKPSLHQAPLCPSPSPILLVIDLDCLSDVSHWPAYSILLPCMYLKCSELTKVSLFPPLVASLFFISGCVCS